MVSTQAANAMTITSDDTLSPLPCSVGPLITHLPNSTLQRPEEKHLPRLERKAQITSPGLPAVKLITIKRPPSMLGGAEEWTDSGHTCGTPAPAMGRAAPA